MQRIQDAVDRPKRASLSSMESDIVHLCYHGVDEELMNGFCSGRMRIFIQSSSTGSIKRRGVCKGRQQEREKEQHAGVHRR
jgi:hypothetical protein